jgi:hypothetical protein
MVKTREFGQPCAATPQPGRCRICRGSLIDGHNQIRAWADETMTLCDKPECIAAARREIGR